MALWRCRECTTAYAVGLPACPHCRSTEYEEDGAMPKITRHGGPSIAGAQIVGGVWSDGTDTDAWPDLDEVEGGEDVSAGSNSSTSPEKPPSSDEPSNPPLPKRAPKTGSRSKRGQTASSTADSTDGSGPATGSEDA